MKIRLERVTKIYAGAKAPAIANVSFSLRDREHALITGESGAGKTTLLKILAMLDTRYRGDYWLNGILMRRCTEQQRGALCRSMGYVFQEYSLLEGESVFYNVSLPLQYRYVSPAKAKERVEEILEILGIEDLIHQNARQISGGQRQRGALARALVGRPNMLLADEPFHALDRKTTERVVEWMRHSMADKQMILSLHEPTPLFTLPCRVFVIENKKLREEISPHPPVDGADEEKPLS